MALDLAAVRERLALLALQWRPASGEAIATGAGAGPRDPDPGDPVDAAGPDPGGGPGRVRGVLAVLAVLVLVAGWWWWQGRPRPVVQAPQVLASGSPLPGTAPTASAVPAPPSPEPESAVSPVTTATTAAAVLVVHVAGPVRQPGVVRLPTGARVVDAVEAAGGLRPGARLGVVNLARPVVDGERVDVGAASVDPVPSGSQAADAPGTTGAALDLNTATQAQLEELPGVGPVLAGRILAWRTENGRFSTIEELQEVAGIGDATYAELAPLVRV